MKSNGKDADTTDWRCMITMQFLARIGQHNWRGTRTLWLNSYNGLITNQARAIKIVLDALKSSLPFTSDWKRPESARCRGRPMSLKAKCLDVESLYFRTTFLIIKR